MFILRTTWPQKGNTSNEVLNDYYEIVYRDSEDFDSYKDSVWPHGVTDESVDMCFGFIICGKVIPLYKNVDYYVMTDNGKTFEKIYVQNHKKTIKPQNVIESDGGYQVDDFYEYQDGDSPKLKGAKFVGDINGLPLEWDKDGILLNDDVQVPKKFHLADLNITKYVSNR